MKSSERLSSNSSKGANDFNIRPPEYNVRRFYDIVRIESVGNWAEILGYERILTTRDWVEIRGKKGEAKKAAKKALKDGKIPVYIAERIDEAKEGTWVENTVMEIRTLIDMQVAHIMKDKNVRALITLDYMRRGMRELQNAARNIVILHKARVPILLASGARKIEDMRAPRDIAAVGKVLGMSIPMALASVSDNWEGIL